MRTFRLLFLVLALVGTALACVGPDRPELAFTPTELPAAQVNQPYKVIIEVSNNETPIYGMNIETGALPVGLALVYEPRSGNQALLSGIPDEAGAYVFTIKATCYATSRKGQTGEYEYMLVVEE